MIIVHHLNNSRSQRVLWLLEELGTPYEIKSYSRDAETNLAPAELKAVHPLGKSPVIEDGGKVIAETGAIVDYLIRTYGAETLGVPVGTDEYERYNYWLHFAEGSAMPQLLLKLFFSRIKEAKMPFFAKPIARKIADQVLGGYVDPNLGNQFAYINAELETYPWFAGEKMTGADIMMSFPLEGAASRSGVEDFPHISAFLTRIHERPAYKRALERGGPYALLS